MGGLANTRSNTDPAWLIDSSIYVFKAWYRSPEQFDIEGNPINAVYGFLDFTYNLLKNESPKFIGFAFDESLETSHRKEIYPLYKANRSPAPDSLSKQFLYCRKFLRAFGIHEAASLHYEADDLIGTWAKALRKQNIPVNFITADKDLTQLVYENDHWWEYQQGQKLNAQAITKKFKAKPRQIADQLAIAGDKSDNIPGVLGIGMATAGKLLKKFDTIENMFANIPEIASMQIRGAKQIQQLIEAHQESIKLSRKLTEIKCNIAQISIDNFKLTKPNREHFNQLCHVLGLSNKTQQQWLELHESICC